MPNHDNGLFEIITQPFQSITLGDGHGDGVEDRSSGANTITLGGGSYDHVRIFAAANDLVTLGNGNDDYVFAGSVYGLTGPNTFNLGDGVHDSVVVEYSLGGNTVSLGNGDGDHVILMYPISSSLNYDNVSLGVGAHDTAVLSTTGESGFVIGLASVTFGGPDATLNLSRTAGPSFPSPTTASETSIVTDQLDVVSGLVKGDHIILSGGAANLDALAKKPLPDLAGVHGQAVFATGIYNASAHTFTLGYPGNDALLTYDDGTNHFVSVVLVGAAGDIAGSTIHHGTITLG